MWQLVNPGYFVTDVLNPVNFETKNQFTGRYTQDIRQSDYERKIQDILDNSQQRTDLWKEGDNSDSIYNMNDEVHAKTCHVIP